MVSISVDNEPANIKVINFCLFLSFEDFSISLDNAIHRTMEIMEIIPIDTLDTSHKFTIVYKL
jgi:hypothetical protein